MAVKTTLLCILMHFYAINLAEEILKKTVERRGVYQILPRSTAACALCRIQKEKVKLML